jgi:nanoRNase/pAp phosphatase (c-di-AMP/oligoRNAs hydrolase)
MVGSNIKKLNFFKRRKFKRILKTNNELTILLRKDPTVDSLASTYALKKIAEYFQVKAKCYYTGVVQHKGMLNIMEPDIEHLPYVITDELAGSVALVDVLPSELPEGLAAMIGMPLMIISHSRVAIKDIKCEYKDIRADVETTSTIMVQYMKSLNVPMDSTVGTLLLFAIRDKTKTFLININRNGLEAYFFILKYMDHDLLLKLENPAVKSETFNDLAKAISNRFIKDTYLLTNTGYVKDPSTLSKVCKYMLDFEGISTALVFAVNSSDIYVYGISNDIEINLKKIFKKAFGHCGNIVGSSSYASVTMPLGLFAAIIKGNNNSDSKKLMMDSISQTISSRFFSTIEEGGDKMDTNGSKIDQKYSEPKLRPREH